VVLSYEVKCLFYMQSQKLYFNVLHKNNNLIKNKVQLAILFDNLITIRYKQLMNQIILLIY